MSSPSMIIPFSTNKTPLIAQEPKLKSSQLWHNLEELSLFNPSAYVPKPTYNAEEEHVPDISLDDVHRIASLLYDTSPDAF